MVETQRRRLCATKRGRIAAPAEQLIGADAVERGQNYTSVMFWAAREACTCPKARRSIPPLDGDENSTRRTRFDTCSSQFNLVQYM